MTVIAESRPLPRVTKLPRNADIGALPTAVDPMALSLNENPFPPLPAVRSALIESIDAARPPCANIRLWSSAQDPRVSPRL